MEQDGHMTGGAAGTGAGTGLHGSSGGRTKAHWAQDAVFYHIYPLGVLGCPQRNPQPVVEPEEAWDPRRPQLPELPIQAGTCALDRLLPWIDHLAGMGFGAVYLGPVFESTSHGYDTLDYFRVDRRLGDNAALRRFVDACHRRGIRVVLDAVLNHVGRDFPAFRDVRSKGRASPWQSWFAKLDFSRRGPAGDDFAYEGWHGHYDLVKLDGSNPAVREHLFSAITHWVEEFGIDGLRLDAADCLDFDFLRALSAHCAGLKPDFWLMGEVVHGDYRQWANPGSLQSVTNYEAYKGLWSSLNDRNYWEIDWTLKRQFGPQGSDNGRYRELSLYNFVDNHDVDRAASVLNDPAKLHLLYTMLFVLPGMPSVYYGSEWGLVGRRQPTHDHDLRPALDLDGRRRREAAGTSESPGLCGHIHALIGLRSRLAALRHGAYRPVHVANEQLAFWRDLGGHPAPDPAEDGLPGRQAQDQSPVLAVFNQSEGNNTLNLDLHAPHLEGKWLVDRLDVSCRIRVNGGRLSLVMPGRQARLFTPE